MSKDKQEAFDTFDFELPPIRGYPELRWAGKRPFRSTQYFPAQKKESYGDPVGGWLNRLYWGDNLQVMSHMLREFRGKVDLIYIDPPFDSSAEYKKIITAKGKSVSGDQSSFEEKQYNDIWNDDEYLQFMYDRLVLCRELLADTGSIFVHLDWRKVHHIRMILDEVFGNGGPKGKEAGFKNEIIWHYKTGGATTRYFNRKHDTILFYTKTADYVYNNIKELTKVDKSKGYNPNTKHIIGDDGETYVHTNPRDIWDLQHINMHDQTTRVGYPTQKPVDLAKKIISSCSNPDGIVFDCFMGSGTTLEAAMQLGRRFIGADINLASLEITTGRLNRVRTVLNKNPTDLFDDTSDRPVQKHYTGFEVFNVNNYDLFRNPIEAKELIKEALELQHLPSGGVFDGQIEQFLVKIMPVNRITTRADLNEVINGLDFKSFESRAAKSPNKPVERIHLVCMGHEPDLGAELVKAAKPFDIEVYITDLIRDKSHMHFKRNSEARLKIEKGNLVIAGFYPMNLLQKLSMEVDAIEDWRQLVESIKIDWNYDGAVLTPTIIDAPSSKGLVADRYEIPDDASTVRVKITDLLSESWEGEIENG